MLTGPWVHTKELFLYRTRVGARSSEFLRKALSALKDWYSRDAGPFFMPEFIYDHIEIL